MVDETPVTQNVRRSWPMTIGLLVGAAAVFSVSQLVWDPDGPNPLGLALMFLSAGLLVAAAICQWRRPKSFARLALWSLVGLPVFAILHNVFYGVGEIAKDVPLLPMVFEYLHVAAFIVAIVLCPVGVVIGVVGWIVTWWFGRRNVTRAAKYGPPTHSSP